ncbi:MAG: sigma D regulator [Gammaproteobacteria bacterium]|nr:sigma D regulator [Gammaproteobacteria bacterium]
MNDFVDRQPANDRRSRTRKEIKQLIAERNEVLSMYCNLAGCDGTNVNTDEIEPEQIQEFCQLLIDYIAIGHFELYQRISEGVERRHEIVKLADTIYPRIEQTTQVAVEFNDKYDSGNSMKSISKEELTSQLSKLGEELATRIELEDQLINTLLTAKSSETAEVLQ